MLNEMFENNRLTRSAVTLMLAFLFGGFLEMGVPISGNLLVTGLMASSITLIGLSVFYAIPVFDMFRHVGENGKGRMLKLGHKRLLLLLPTFAAVVMMFLAEQFIDVQGEDNSGVLFLFIIFIAVSYLSEKWDSSSIQRTLFPDRKRFFQVNKNILEFLGSFLAIGLFVAIMTAWFHPLIGLTLSQMVGVLITIGKVLIILPVMFVGFWTFGAILPFVVNFITKQMPWYDPRPIYYGEGKVI